MFDDFGRTPLALAVEYGKLKIAKIFVDEGADPLAGDAKYSWDNMLPDDSHATGGEAAGGGDPVKSRISNPVGDATVVPTSGDVETGKRHKRNQSVKIVFNSVTGAIGKMNEAASDLNSVFENDKVEW